MMASTDESAAFGERLGSIVNDSLTTMNMVVGNAVGLFDVMANVTDEQNHKTSIEIAAAANLKERYVREWLCSMVVGDIIDCDTSGTKFWLQKHKAAFVRSDNMESPLKMASFIPCLIGVTDKLADCFKLDGPTGLSYDNYNRFHELEATFSDFIYEKRLLSEIVPKVPGLQEQLEAGRTFLDIGCGSGKACCILGKQFPNSKFTGIDFSQEAVGLAKAQSTDLKNVNFECLDAAKLSEAFAVSFDVVSAFDSIHDQAYPDKVLAQIFKVIKPGGRFVVMDIQGTGNCVEDKALPWSNFGYTGSLFHCMPVSLYFDGGMGLGAMWGKVKAKIMFEQAGFVVEECFPAGIENVIYICKKP